MPNYRTHNCINMLIILPIFATLLFFYLHPTLNFGLSFAGSFIYGTLFMSPDLDLANKVKILSVRGFLSLPFRSYARVFRHRGLSHSLVFGTVTRVGWLFLYFLAFAFILYLFDRKIDSYLSYLKEYRLYIFYGLAGLFLADASHITLDRFMKN